MTRGRRPSTAAGVVDGSGEVGGVAGARASGTSTLGGRIRARRRERGLTLVAVAERAGLSHPFLSQVERGRAQPSMASLFRIARALGVTQDWLLAAGDEPAERGPVALLRHDEGAAVPVSRTDGVARRLLGEPGRFVPTEFTDVAGEFDEFLTHPGTEFLYQLEGVLEVELGDPAGGEHRAVRLTPGDCLRYPGSVPHRWRSGGGGRCRVLMVHTDVPDPGPPDP